jgi:site-specific recombinase XerD
MNQYSENTIENYFTDVKLFLEFIKHEMSVNTVRTDDITMVIIDKWKKALSETLAPKTSIDYKDKPTLSLQTIQSKLVAIKSLLKYLNDYYDCALNYKKIETKRVKSDYVNCITDEERNLFFNFI